MKDNFTDRDVLTQNSRPAVDTKGGSATSSFSGSTTATHGTTTAPQGGAVRRDSAQGMASKLGDNLEHSAEQHKAEGANFVGGFAGAVRRAAHEFDGNAPMAAQYIRLAADQLDGVADAVRRRDFNRIMADVQNFARQRPVAFLGAAMFAGFAAVRLLKTSAPASQRAGGAFQRDAAGRHWSPPTAMNMPE